MDLFEYQGKQFIAAYGVEVADGKLATSLEEARNNGLEIGFPCVVKAQVHAGGRGKAGGIKVAKDEAELKDIAKSILGMDIKGHVVDRLWIERACEIDKEYYVSFTLDRSARMYLLMLSSKGGVEIEEVSKLDPSAIILRHIDPIIGVDESFLKEAVQEAGIEIDAIDDMVKVLTLLYRAFVDGDADLLEINPLILDSSGKIRVLDAKVTLDDNANFRHPEWAPYLSTVEYDSREKRAKELGLNYIGLSGSIGIIANGAGLAMATLDVVNQVGGSAANFLDLGGSASADTMVAALEVINDDENVRAILVNIFGGIVRCDLVALGIREALNKVTLHSPIVIRLDGTNADLAYELLRPLVSENLRLEKTMVSAANKAVEIAQAKDC